MTGHDIIEQAALAGDRWRVRCSCGEAFTARDQRTAGAAHLHHYEMVKAREVAAEGIPAARAALARHAEKHGPPALRIVKGDG